MKFSDFQELDLPDLLINIWSYSDVNYNSSILKQYKKWCIRIAKSATYFLLKVHGF